MKIFIDADACPVTDIAVKLARYYNIEVFIFCDTNHIMSNDYAKVVTVGAGADAVDFEIVNRCGHDDIVITQDYGVAAMSLGRGAKAIHQSGMVYTDDNIDSLLAQRHMAKELRRASSKNHFKGPKKRTGEDNESFSDALERLINLCLSPIS